MEPFRMDTDAVAAAGTRIGALAGETASGAVAGAATMGALAPVFGVIGGDYLAALVGALGSTDVEVGRLAAYYASAGTATAQSVAVVAASETTGAASVFGVMA
ncbi:hypothetical protein P0W64_11165 [Tsukamurella sp. 8F]|uniref:hypothetical protein n=1 Tax=unclassified Tsukamurella TaxID=2633480 RepID=UPI0023BA1FB1|nr:MULTISPECIES: hypothetical protein [unclassified Tsukamurella]MDF0528956.1 hypothetical protein [Tsukamurella sp. 8J]MDF0587329.1 hypothetical protein [Tsukamurella sp. 8F]